MRDVLAVLAGGLVGTGLRLGLDSVLPHEGFAVSTLVANTVGALALGMLVARLWDRVPSWLRAGLGAGLLGSFTTFSALAVALVSLGAAGDWMPALAYLVATMALGLGAAWLGLRIGRPRATAPLDLVDE
ncbi:fluoride efflux transporter FluC [Salinibacterium soli]|uniref:Fluoride-specific ion channel FluC n=1 Tax=Antiquaquibacter soli TaxID=3064523 RepID=A0ABT9BPP2_9MICO|nr:CrcB family protein [Protaetiibacter sp. WY-16]MDO7882979.1 CrcB family protein [Protaetiibacter sp. WY-16]